MLRRNTNIKESMDHAEDCYEEDCLQTRSLVDSFRKQSRLSRQKSDGDKCSPTENAADDMAIDIKSVLVSITASTEPPVHLPTVTERTSDVMVGYLKEFKESKKDMESTMGHAV